MPLPAARSPLESGQAETTPLLIYFVLGIAFGITLMKSEVVSWFRIQEMFRFQAFHMYGVMASALATATTTLALIRWLGVTTLDGAPIAIEPKTLRQGYRYAIGGGIFGMGWALTGACPGPLFALLGGGISVFAVTILAALAGTWTYGCLRSRLPE
jgi:uncharacterized membrane protein YedE/YeeE